MILLFPDAFAPYIATVFSTDVPLKTNKLLLSALAFADFISAALKSRTISSLIEK